MGTETMFGVEVELNDEGADAVRFASEDRWPTNTPRADRIWRDAEVGGNRLTLLTEFKNYDGDIEAAAAWIRRHLAADVPPEQVIASSWCEANLLPVLYTAGGE